MKVIFLRGLARRYLLKGGRPLAILLLIKDERLAAIAEHAAIHHPKEAEAELTARAIFRYACHHPASWLLPWLAILSALGLIAAYAH